MKNAKAKTIRYTDDGGEIAGRLKRVADFLPPPEELAGALPKQTKITLSIDNETLKWFKAEAGKTRGASYQRMIRNLLAIYVRRQRPVPR